ncbi:hypothetical protein BH24ACT4_BH24ACT4_08320 [soil metagenome]
MRCRWIWVATIVVSLLLLLACGGPETDATVVGSPSSSNGPTATTDGTATSDPAATDPPRAGSDPGRLTFRPVLVSAVPCEAPEGEPGATGTTAPAPTGRGEVLPLADPDLPGACVEVGPADLDGTAIATAEAAPSAAVDGGWEVVVTVAEEAQCRANAVFNACADAAPECPGVPGGRDQGQLAIVLDDEVVSAPAVNSRDLADDEFVISGGGASGFTQGEAEDLVATLGG